MNGYEKEINSREEQKNRIRERYKGVDRSELEFIPAKPKEKLFEDTTEKRVCAYCRVSTDRKSTRLNSSHPTTYRMPSSA